MQIDSPWIFLSSTAGCDAMWQQSRIFINTVVKTKSHKTIHISFIKLLHWCRLHLLQRYNFESVQIAKYIWTKTAWHNKVLDIKSVGTFIICSLNHMFRWLNQHDCDGGKGAHPWKAQSAHKILIRKTHEKSQHGEPGWEYNIQKDLKINCGYGCWELVW